MTDAATFWLDRPTFVTGATGLVGGWTVKRLLEHGADVICLVRDDVPHSMLMRDGLCHHVKTVRGDITDRDLIERALNEYEIDTIIHLAAQTLVPVANRNPASTFESNVRGTWQLLEAARRTPTVNAIVLASSDKAYGSQPTQPYNEAMPLQGIYPYDCSKSCSDLIGQSYAKSFDMPVAITRCGNFYGGGDLNWNRLVPGTIRSVLRGHPPVIRSDGSFIRDYFYVEDGAAAYMHLAQQLHSRADLRGEAFNFSTNEAHDVLAITRMILGFFDSDLRPTIRNEVSNEIREQRLDSTKARDMLKWSPSFQLNEGLARTIDWYRTFFGSAT